MEYYPFPAQLCAPYNDTQEYGQAVVSPGDNAVDFTADFIPLMPLGTQACVDWMLGTRSVERLEGHVYLSSPGLVRVVDIDSERIGRLRRTFAINTDIPAHVSAAEGGRPVPATILYLSRRRLTLQLSDASVVGPQLILNAEVDFLTLSDMALQVRQQVLLRRQDILLLCDIPPGSNENLIAHSAYLSRLEQLP